MAAITLFRTDQQMPDEATLAAARRILTGVIDGFSNDDKRAWRGFLRRLLGMEPGEMARVEAVMPRLGWYHRKHMKLEQALFDGQERFSQFEQFRIWLKFGAGWVDWIAGPKGGVIPAPRSVSYAAADQAQFEQYHAQVVEFLRGEHAAPYLWRHLPTGQAAEMMDAILEGFDE